MTKFYSAGGSQSVSLVDGIQVVKRVVNRIKSIIQMPLSRKQRQVKRKKCGEIREAIQQRIAGKMQKKQTYKRNKLEKKLKNANLDIAAEFSDVDKVIQEGIRDILAGKVVGR